MDKLYIYMHTHTPTIKPNLHILLLNTKDKIMEIVQTNEGKINNFLLSECHLFSMLKNYIKLFE